MKKLLTILAALVTLLVIIGAVSPSSIIYRSPEKVSYDAGEHSVQFKIAHAPRKMTLASCPGDWITDLSFVDKKTVSYHVSENTSYFPREGAVAFYHGEECLHKITVIQEGAPVKALHLNAQALDLMTGVEFSLLYEVAPSDTPLKWSSSDETVVSVDESGVLKAVGNGNAVVTVRSEDKMMSSACEVHVSTPVSSVVLDVDKLRMGPGSSASLKASVLPESASDKILIWSSSNAEVVSVDSCGRLSAKSVGIAKITAYSVDSSAFSSCTVKVMSTAPKGSVDLGLSVFWATCNVGAAKPESYGNHFAWGEILPKKRYDWATYKWGRGSLDMLTKYVSSSQASWFGYDAYCDDLSALEAQDDVASVKLGGKWRTPTKEEWLELIEKCTWTRLTVNKVLGYKVSSNIPGYEGRYIFLPAAGLRNESMLDADGFYGNYWSSSLNEDMPVAAYQMNFGSGNIGVEFTTRTIGQSVRPVSD